VSVFVREPLFHRISRRMSTKFHGVVVKHTVHTVPRYIPVHDTYVLIEQKPASNFSTHRRKWCGGLDRRLPTGSKSKTVASTVNRTRGLQIFSLTLSQLSYRSSYCYNHLVIRIQSKPTTYDSPALQDNFENISIEEARSRQCYISLTAR
jgi:hypothetical protein